LPKRTALLRHGTYAIYACQAEILAKFWPKPGRFATKVKIAMRDWMGAVQKETPTGGGDPVGVADVDWQPGRRSGCQSCRGRWEEEIVARLMMCI
jgi:hypothetical protein